MQVKRFEFQVAPLDTLLPEGVPRNSLIGILGETGTGKSVLLNEIAYRALKRGENVLFILLEDTPLSRVLNFESLGFEVLPYLREGRLKFIDCFSYRLAGKDIELPDELAEIHSHVEKSIVEVEDPRNEDILWDYIERESRAIKGRGMVLLDSLTECLTIATNPRSLLDLIKALKAVVSKYYFVPFIYTFHFGFYDEFRYALEVASDGVIDLRFNPEVIKEMLVKQMRIRRMSGSYHLANWVTFDIERGKGLVVVK